MAKIRTRLPLKKRRLSLKLRKKLKRSLLRAKCPRRRRSSLPPPRLPLMPLLKLMRDFLQNLPQLLLKEEPTHGTSESEMDLSNKIQSSVISFQMK